MGISFLGSILYSAALLNLYARPHIIAGQAAEEIPASIGGHRVISKTRLTGLGEQRIVAVSRSGKKIATISPPLSSGPGSPWKVIVRETGKTAEKTLEIPFTHATPYDWSPDDRSLVLSGSPEEAEAAPAGSSAWLVNGDTGDHRRLTPLTVDVNGAQLFPDGASMVFSATEKRGRRGFAPSTDSWLFSIRTSKDNKSVKRLARGQLPRISPDGRQIAYLETIRQGRTQTTVLKLMSSDGKPLKTLPLQTIAPTIAGGRRSQVLPGFTWLDNRTLLAPLLDNNGKSVLVVLDVKGKTKDVMRGMHLLGGNATGRHIVVEASGITWLLTLDSRSQ